MNHPRGANAATTTTTTCGFEDDLGMHGDELRRQPSLPGDSRELSGRSLATSSADSASLHASSQRMHHSDC